MIFSAICAEGNDIKKNASGTKVIESRERKNAIFGFKIGLMTAGDVKVDDVTSRLKSGYSLGAFYDFKTSVKTSLGFAIETHRIKPDSNNIEKNMLDLSIYIKGTYYSNSSNFFFRPCLSAGYGRIGGEMYYPSSNYVIIKGSLEALIFPEKGNVGCLAEIGFICSPWGQPEGYSEAKISAKPRLLIRIGMAIR
jgi:hypothetical protein